MKPVPAECPDCGCEFTVVGQIATSKSVQNYEAAINYAKETYTKLVMEAGVTGPGLSEFEMTIDALSKGLDPKKYIEDACKEVQGIKSK